MLDIIQIEKMAKLADPENHSVLFSDEVFETRIDYHVTPYPNELYFIALEGKLKIPELNDNCLYKGTASGVFNAITGQFIQPPEVFYNRFEPC